MADPFAPVAAGIIPPDPNQGMRSLSSILGIQQQRQALATGQATQQSAQARATIDTQGTNENFNLAKLLSDPVGNGIIDSEGNPTKNAQSIVMRAAPTTGSDAYDKVVNAAQRKLEFNSSVNNLRGSERKEVVDALTGPAADPNASYDDVKSQLNNVVESKKGTPVYEDYRKIADTTIQSLDHVNKKQKDAGQIIQPGQEAWRGGALNLGRSVLGASGVVGAGGIAAPQTGTMSSGASQQPGTFAPALQGGAFAPSGPATQTQIPPGYTMVNGQLVRADNSGLSLPAVRGGEPAAPAPGSKLQTIPRPGVNANPGDIDRYNKTMGENRQHIQDTSDAANNLQNGVGPTRYRNDQIQDILNSKTFSPTGPGAAQLNWISSKIPGQSGDAFQKIGHYLAQNSAALAQKMGVPGTNMGAEQAAAAAGNTSQNRGALLEVTKVNDAMNTALDMYNRGLAKVSGNGSDPGKVSAYKQAFGQNFDMNVLRYDDALRRNDRAEIDRIKKETGPAGLKAMGAKRKVLHSLAETGDLP